MPRNMSFSATLEAVRTRRKTVTRRQGWDHLKPGDELWAVEKAMGLKKGEKIKRICLIRVVHVDRLPIDLIDQEDVYREGFDTTPEAFVRFYCRFNKVAPSDLCTRIEFEYI